MKEFMFFAIGLLALSGAVFLGVVDLGLLAYAGFFG